MQGDKLCPQEYDGMTMYVTPCDRCKAGWNKRLRRCNIETGAEHLTDSKNIPTCPIQDRCQHQVQETGPCLVRRKGLICESALVAGGLSEEDAAAHPLSFHAYMMIDPEIVTE